MINKSELCKVILFGAIFLLTVFHNNSDCGTYFTVNDQTNRDVKAQIKKTLPLIIKACPGLEKYAEDLSPAEVRKSTLLNPVYNGGLLFEFVVSENPEKLPRPLNIYSKGNHCFIDVSKTADKMYISKRACHSLCTGIWTENDPGLMGREFDLVP